MPESPPTVEILGHCEVALLRVLVMRAPSPTTRAQLAVLSGYSSTSGTFARAIAVLRRNQLVRGASGALVPTPAGEAMIGRPDRLPMGRALVRYWQSKLSRCEAAILEVLVQAHPLEPSHEALAARAGYSPKSGTFAASLARLRALRLVEGRRASSILFEDDGASASARAGEAPPERTDA